MRTYGFREIFDYCRSFGLFKTLGCVHDDVVFAKKPSQFLSGTVYQITNYLKYHQPGYKKMLNNALKGIRNSILMKRLLYSSKKSILICFVLTLSANLVTYVQPILVQQTIARFQTNSAISLQISAIIASMTLVALLSASAGYLSNKLNHKFVRNLREIMAKVMVESTYERVITYRAGDLAARLTNDAQAVAMGVTDGLIQGSVGGISLVAVIAMMFFLSWELSLITLATLGLVCLAVMKVVPVLQNSVEISQKAVGDISANVANYHAGAAEIRVNQAEDRAYETLSKYITLAYKGGLKGARANAYLAILATSSVQLILLVVIGSSLMLIRSGRLDISLIVSFLMYIMYLVGPIGSLISSARTIGGSMAASPRVEEILNLTRKPKAHQLYKSYSDDFNIKRVEIRLENVSFSYPGAAQKVLEDISMTIPAGSLVALIGESGSGKSSLLSILAGLYTPTSGSIYLNDGKIEPRELLKVSGLVSYARQRPWIAPATVLENVMFGVKKSKGYELDAISALQKFNLTAKIVGFPLGLAASLDETNGILSGGEAQRLSLARAFARESYILLLDEVTSNLDSRNERLAFEAVRGLRGRRTVVIATHKRKVAEICDLVAVMKNGQLVALGDPKTILNDASATAANFMS